MTAAIIKSQNFKFTKQTSYILCSIIKYLKLS